MKAKISLTIFSIFYLLMAAHAANEYYVLKAIEYQSNFFAIWGSTENGKEFEDRYDAMLFEIYKKSEKIGEISAYQHWFQKDRKEYPKIGETITVEEFNYKINDLAIPEGKNNIDYNRLKIIDKPSNK
jgi:hypothetical protein